MILSFWIQSNSVGKKKVSQQVPNLLTQRGSPWPAKVAGVVTEIGNWSIVRTEFSVGAGHGRRRWLKLIDGVWVNLCFLERGNGTSRLTNV